MFRCVRRACGGFARGRGRSLAPWDGFGQARSAGDPATSCRGRAAGSWEGGSCCLWPAGCRGPGRKAAGAACGAWQGGHAAGGAGGAVLGFACCLLDGHAREHLASGWSGGPGSGWRTCERRTGFAGAQGPQRACRPDARCPEVAFRGAWSRQVAVPGDRARGPHPR